MNDNDDARSIKSILEEIEPIVDKLGPRYAVVVTVLDTKDKLINFMTNVSREHVTKLLSDNLRHFKKAKKAKKGMPDGD